MIGLYSWEQGQRAKEPACWHCADYSTAREYVMVHRRVLKPVLLATTVFCVGAALTMFVIGVAAAGRAPDSCINEQRFVQDVCELRPAYWFGCAVCFGTMNSTRHSAHSAEVDQGYRL